jgi:hypothetical protein
MYVASIYWGKCKRETARTPGVECSSWVVNTHHKTSKILPAIEWFRFNDTTAGKGTVSEMACRHFVFSFLFSHKPPLSVDTHGRLIFRGAISSGCGSVSVRTTEHFGTQHVVIPKDAKAVRVVVEGDGQMWRLNLGTSHSMMGDTATWTHEFMTTKGMITSTLLHLRSFTPQASSWCVSNIENFGNSTVFTDTREKCEGESEVTVSRVRSTYLHAYSSCLNCCVYLPMQARVPLDKSAVVNIGLVLSLVNQAGKKNKQFSDGPFQIVLHEVEFVCKYE